MLIAYAQIFIKVPKYSLFLYTKLEISLELKIYSAAGIKYKYCINTLKKTNSRPAPYSYSYSYSYIL